MNDNFNQIVLASGKSLYEISFGTGIPYTTISQLHNNKRDINKVAAETIVKLALYFNKEVNDILNPISYISGIRGKEGHSRYWWGKDDSGIYLSIKLGRRPALKHYSDSYSDGKELFKYQALIAKIECEEAETQLQLQSIAKRRQTD